MCWRRAADLSHCFSHSQGITTVPLPNSWPSHQNPYYSVGKRSPISACREGTGQTMYCQTVQGVVGESTAQPLVFLGECGQGPTDDEKNGVLQTEYSASQLCLTSCFSWSWEEKNPAFPRSAAAPAPAELMCCEGVSPSSPQPLVAAGAVFLSSWKEMMCKDRNVRAGSQGSTGTAWGPRGQARSVHLRGSKSPMEELN